MRWTLLLVLLALLASLLPVVTGEEPEAEEGRRQQATTGRSVAGDNDGEDEHQQVDGEAQQRALEAAGALPPTEAAAEEEEEGEENLYFYLNDEEASLVVTEYEAPPAGQEDKPDFIFQPGKGHIRVVEFYAHWCPHCQRFFPKFVAIARRVKELFDQQHQHDALHAASSSDIQSTLGFYGVSCVPHKPLCHHFDVQSYPAIFLFKDESAEGVQLDHQSLHPFAILREIGIDNLDASIKQENFEVIMKRQPIEDDEVGHGDLSRFWIPRTKAEIYDDAYLSFDFAMRHAIHVGRGPLSDEARTAFTDWIQLLEKTLPPTWRLLSMVEDISEHLDEALESEEGLEKIVSHHPPETTTWSQPCTRGDLSMGYTCGLWQLFHIAAMGVVEWNSNNVAGGDNSYYTTHEVAEILRSYVDHFFGCEVCRHNFLAEYESCAFGRCDRLIEEIGSVDDWKELPLWLSEFHNGVNVRLMRERANREGREATNEEVQAAHWPAGHQCPTCWHDDGSWDPDKIFIFMQLIYWPEELVPAALMEELMSGFSHKNGGALEEEAVLESWVYSLVGFLLASTVLSAASWAQKRREIVRTGKHKKEDDGVCDKV